MSSLLYRKRDANGPKGYGIKTTPLENERGLDEIILSTASRFGTRMWYWNVITFLCHAAASIWLLVLIANAEENCHGFVNRVHYVEQYPEAVLADQPFPSTLPIGSVGIWPVQVHNEDMVLMANTQLNTTRCLQGSDRRPEEVARQTNLIRGLPSLYAACVSTGMFDTIETAYDQWHSSVLGSNNSILYLLLLFEWISASFALYYIDPPLYHKAKSELNEIQKEYYLDYILTGSVILWNMMLLFLTLGFAKHDAWAIPANNVIIGVVTLVSAMIAQIMYALPMGSTEDEKSRLTGNNYLQLHMDDSVMEKDKMRTLRFRMSATELRYTEYAITAPILALSIQSTVTNSYVWAVQVMYLCILVTNLLGIPMHQSLIMMVSLYQKIRNYTEVWFLNWMGWILGMILLSSWGVFCGAWVPYFDSIIFIWDYLPKENRSIAALLVLLPVFYCLFGLAATYTYVRWMLNYTDSTWTIHWLRYDMIWLNIIFDFLSVFIKILAVVIVLMSDQFGPRTGCPLTHL